MYVAIWRLLPGPRWVKALEAALLALACVAVLFTWVFPALADTLGLLEVTMVGE